MACYSPTTIWSKKKGASIGVPCGKCVDCLKKRRSEWTFRLKEELNNSIGAHFITLTYNETHLPFTIGDGKIFRVADIFNQPQQEIWRPLKETLYPADVTLFLKRLRSNLRVEVSKDNQTLLKRKIALLEPPKLKYYYIGEYGPNTDRPHYHMILFNLPNEYRHLIVNSWDKFGFVHIGQAEGASIAYTASYLINGIDNDYTDIHKPFSRMSKNIGISYLGRAEKWHIENKFRYVIDEGKKIPMPRYYKKLIFTNSHANDLYAKEAIKKADKLHAERHDKFRKNGEDPFEVDNLRREGNREIITRKIKQRKL